MPRIPFSSLYPKAHPVGQCILPRPVSPLPLSSRLRLESLRIDTFLFVQPSIYWINSSNSILPVDSTARPPSIIPTSVKLNPPTPLPPRRPNKLRLSNTLNSCSNRNSSSNNNSSSNTVNKDLSLSIRWAGVGGCESVVAGDGVGGL